MSARTEPILTAAGLAGAIAAVLALLVNFGVPITGGQNLALMTLVAVLAPFILAFMRASHLITPVAGESWPVFNAAVMATIVSAVLGVLSAFGYIVPEGLDKQLTTFILSVFPFAVAALDARRKVTPDRTAV